MVLEASDAIPPLTKESSMTTKCIPEKDIIQVAKSNTQRLAEIKVWGDGQDIGSNVSISTETKRAHTLSEGDWSVTLLREQQYGERHLGGRQGRGAIFLELGAKVEGLIYLLFRYWKHITVKWEKEHKDWISLSDACWMCYENGL